MIGVLGLKRVILLAFFVGLNVVLGGLYYGVLLPFQASQTAELNTLQSQVSTVRSDVARMQVEFEELEAQKGAFQTLQKDGFFQNQSRKLAESFFSKIQKEAGVGNAIATVDSGAIEENEEAVKAKHKILKSSVKIELKAVDDVDIFRYLYLVEASFPGHMAVEKIELKRESDVDGTVLRAIASGANPPLVSARVDMLWRTMIPESDVIGAMPTDGVVQ